MKSINDLLESYKPNNFFVLQIGAHDGITADPISNKVKKNSWSGLFVEPVDYLFERLKLNYKGYDNLKFENSVISNTKGYVDFYERKNIKPTIFSKYGNKIFVLLILLYIFLIFSFNRSTNE